MESTTIGLLASGIFFILLIAGTKIAFAAALSGFFGFICLYGFDASLAAIRMHLFSATSSYTMTVIPLFVLMGFFGHFIGVGEDLYKAGQRWLGRLPGGMAMGTVLASAFFGAISGSSNAATAMFSKIAVPEMDKYGYNRSLSLGSVAASGTLASLIPPSTIIVIYGLLTEQSIGKVLIAGIIPGFVSALIYCLMIYFRVLVNPKLGPRGAHFSLKAKGVSLIPLWPVIAIFVFVIGGLYIGVFTPTEAGALGAFSMVIVALVKRKLNWEMIRNAMFETVYISCMIFLIIIGVQFFSALVATTGLTGFLVNQALNLSPTLLLIGVLGVYLILGAFIGVLGMLVTTLPFVFPVMMGAGYDPIWFGVIVIKFCEIGMITPPIGINAFITAKGAQAPLEKVFQSIVPFLLMDLTTVALLIIFPQIITFLPSHVA